MNYGPAAPHETGELVLLDLLASRWRAQHVVVFDVGANVGDYALAVLDHFKNVELHCFEPSPNAFALLEARIGSSGAHVHLHRFGLGEFDETVTLYGEGPASGLSSVYRRRLGHFGIDFEPQGEVLLRRLDDVALELGVDRIDLLKLDIEGHELAALKGARRLIGTRGIEGIQFEFGGANIDAHVFFQDLWYFLAPQYRIHRVLQDGLVELPRYEEIYEIFLTSNYFCLLKDDS